MSNTKQQATALKYSLERDSRAPIVVASGMGHVAQRIVDVAMENNVPIYEDDSLSALLSQLQVGSQVPPELFQAIVDIYIYFLNYKLPTNGDAGGSETPLIEPAKAQGRTLAPPQIREFAMPQSTAFPDGDDDFTEFNGF